MHWVHPCAQKRRAAAAARKRAEEPLRPLTDEEKGDVVGTALEGLDAEIAAVRRRAGLWGARLRRTRVRCRP